MAYSEITSPSTMSTIVGLINAQQEQIRSFERSTAAAGPTVKPVGLVHNRTDYSGSGYTGAGEVLVRWNGTTYALLMDLGGPALCAAGTVEMQANLPMGGNRIVGLADAIADGDAVTLSQLESMLAGPYAADVDLGGFLILNCGDPASQASMDALARITDTFQNPHGLFFKADALNFDDGSGGASPVNINVCSGGRRSAANAATSFCPRKLRLRLGGSITALSGGGGPWTLASAQYETDRWGDESGWVTIGTASPTGFGAPSIDVQIQWETSLTPSGRGFYLRLKNHSSSVLYTSADARCNAFGGVSADGAP